MQRNLLKKCRNNKLAKKCRKNKCFKKIKKTNTVVCIMFVLTTISTITRLFLFIDREYITLNDSIDFDSAPRLMNDSIAWDDTSKESTDTTKFKRYDGVVIVTKVLGLKDQLQVVRSWTCFINHAYNDKMRYDIIVFTTIPFESSEIANLQEAAKPANLTVVLEGPPLEEQLAVMTKDELEFLYKRCDKKENETLSWFHHCGAPESKNVASLGYSWQAEFRAYHIWNHPALKDYKYMMWFDSDTLVGREWNVDPMQIMIENDLTVMYAGFPYGITRNNTKLGQKLMDAYNTSICGVENVQKHIYAKLCKDKPATMQMVAGNHHITNLHVFRKDVHQNFLKAFTGEYRFDRDSDDQLAVAIVGLMEQYIQNNFTKVPSRYTLWHERSNGLTLKIAHHGMYDAVRNDRAPMGKGAGFIYRFLDRHKESWTGLEERCRAIILNRN